MKSNLLPRLFSSLAVCSAMLLGTSLANASVVTFSGFKVGSSRTQIQTPIRALVSAGEFTGTLDGITFTSFCIDLQQHIGFGVDYYDYSLRPLGTAGADFSTMQQTRFNQLYTNYFAASRADAAHSAAFQNAVWEITYDGNGALAADSGNFSIGASTNAQVSALVRQWLSDLDAKATGNWEFTRMASATQQDQLLAAQTNGNVPAPATLMLIFLGGMTMAKKMKKGKKKAAKK